MLQEQSQQAKPRARSMNRSATCSAIVAAQLQAQARVGTRNLAPAAGADGTFLSTPNHAWNVAFCPLCEVNRRTGRTVLRPLCSTRRPIRLTPASSESFRALPFVFANHRADAHTRPPDEVARLQSPKGLTCPPFRLSVGSRRPGHRRVEGRSNQPSPPPIADIAQNRLTTSQLPSPDSAAPSQRPNTTSPPSFDAAQSTELLTGLLQQLLHVSQRAAAPVQVTTLPDLSASLPTYSGDGSISASQWIEELERTRNLASWEPSTLLAIALGKLRGAAADWKAVIGLTLADSQSIEYALQGIADVNLATTIAAQRPETVAAYMDIVTHLDQTLSHSSRQLPRPVYSSAKLSTPSPQAPCHIEERMNVQAVSDKTRAPQRISALPVEQEARYLTISARHALHSTLSETLDGSLVQCALVNATIAGIGQKVRTDEADAEELPLSEDKASPSSAQAESQAHQNFCSDSGECTGLRESPEKEHKHDTHTSPADDVGCRATPSDPFSTINAAQSGSKTETSNEALFNLLPELLLEAMLQEQSQQAKPQARSMNHSYALRSHAPVPDPP
ncbi:hypothetical protein HPB50_024690 [Hyalomma asiaticum]|uniref:Uncharacterized protein n=1 Tax=Hyalomma asiaticum TaxID=266040 RepID=A0ACB7S9F7_HYAAI|nr:hypothetical protein HPB50_024690 [Hyalomma asiaticum]